MQKNNNNLLPISLVLTALILGGFYYAVEMGKQKSIERQERTLIDVETKKEQDEVQIRQLCNKEAQEGAAELLKDKQELAKGTALESTLEGAAEKDMYLKTDFDKLYSQCLSRHAIKE